MAKEEVRKYFDPEAVFKEQLGFIRQYGLKTYAKADIDLSVARTDEEYNIPGNNLAVVKIDAACYIKLNEKTNAKLDLRENREILDAPFYRFYITNDAAAGKECKLRIGRASLFRVIPLGNTGLVNTSDVDINPATEDTLAARLNITLSALRDAITAAGVDAKTLNDLYGYLARYAQLPAALTAAGNLKLSVEEAAIKTPVDVQDHLVGSVALHPSAARTASGNTLDIDIGKYLYGESCIDVTAFADMASCDIIVEGKDEVSTKYRPIHSFNATAVAINWLTITCLAFRLVRVRWVVNTPGAAPSITFSVGLQGKS